MFDSLSKVCSIVPVYLDLQLRTQSQLCEPSASCSGKAKVLNVLDTVRAELGWGMGVQGWGMGDGVGEARVPSKAISYAREKLTLLGLPPWQPRDL